MIGAQKLEFDLFLHQINAQSRNRVFEILAQNVSGLCDTETNILHELFDAHFEHRDHAIRRGVAIFDVKSPIVRKPALVISTFEHDVDFSAADGRDVNIMASIISPHTTGATHLQRVAAVSRMFKSLKLCDALRSCKDADEMSMLFTPSQDWMIAA